MKTTWTQCMVLASGVGLLFGVALHLWASGAEAAPQLCRKGFFPVSGQTTAYTANTATGVNVAVPDDGTLQAGKALSYQDNGDGTITDLNTGLIWEKKSDDGGLHDKDNHYQWSSANTIWDFINAVNTEGGAGFAGHSDWRIPNVRELQSIVNHQNFQPAVSAAFNSGCVANCTVLTCSCTVASSYWSSTTIAANFGDFAWSVDFQVGSASGGDKSDSFFVRAVRGGCLD